MNAASERIFKESQTMVNEREMEKLKKLATWIRYDILTMTTEAGSGHPTSSLSATELMTCLLFGGIFRFDVDHPLSPNNGRLIFFKGHASPLYYALWAAAGAVSESELLTFRKFGSPLEGHPTIATKTAKLPIRRRERRSGSCLQA